MKMYLSNDKLYVARMMIIVCDSRVQNVVGKGENTGYTIFSFPHNVFTRLLFQVRSVGFVQYKVNPSKNVVKLGIWIPLNLIPLDTFFRP